MLLVVFGVHGIGGAWGALMTGVFASEAIGGVKGLLEGNGVIVLEQLVGIVATFLYSGIATFYNIESTRRNSRIRASRT